MNKESVLMAVKEIVKLMEENKDLLTETDAKFGDGDLGVSMLSGFTAMRNCLNSLDETDLGKMFMRCAAKMNETAPSSLGTILSFGMIGMADFLKGKVEVDTSELALAMEKGVLKIMEKAKSKPG